jgi:hypothetical protein
MTSSGTIPGYAETRSRHEPLLEMMQIKGNSEVYRKFWAADEFADWRTPIRSRTRATARSSSRTSFATG